MASRRGPDDDTRDTALERRAHARIALRVPVRVVGFDHDGTPWEEMSSSLDVSRGGLTLQLRAPVQRGHVLKLTAPVPKAFRAYDETAPSYQVYAVVRGVGREGEEDTRVGVMFLGRSAPLGFEERPGALYLLPSDPVAAWSEPRKHARFPARALVELRWLEPWSGEDRAETTVTENLSAGGACIPTSLPLSRGDVVEVDEVGGLLATRAVVQNLTVTPDRVPRVHLQFAEDRAAYGALMVLRREGYGL